MNPHLPRVFHDMVTAWRNGADQIPKLLNGTFRGITNFMPGYWTIVGVTKQAYAVMDSRGWRGNFAKDLRRDHIKSGRAFQQHLLDHPVTYAGFCELVADFGRCVVCTKEENPARSAGYGHTYQNSDILWLAQPIDTAMSMAVPTTKAMADALKTAEASANA
jgi:hypothetical protein